MTSKYSEVGHQYFLLNSVLHQWINLAKSRGFPMAALAEQLGAHAGQVADLNGWLPLSTLEHLLHIVQTYFDDPLLGLYFSHNASPASFGTPGYLTQACSTLDEAFQATARYERRLSDFGTNSLQYAPGMVLQMAGSSYREIMDGLRFGIAKASLQDPKLYLRKFPSAWASRIRRRSRVGFGQLPGRLPANTGNRIIPKSQCIPAK